MLKQAEKSLNLREIFCFAGRIIFTKRKAKRIIWLYTSPSEAILEHLNRSSTCICKAEASEPSSPQNNHDVQRYIMEQGALRMQYLK
jgi:hypothetical protein